MLNDQSRKTTISDIHQDNAFLSDLLDGYVESARTLHIQLEKNKQSFVPQSYALYNEQELLLKKHVSNIQQDLKGIEIDHVQDSEILTIIDKQYGIFDQIRTLVSILVGIYNSLDWQSPSFYSSNYSQAGKDTGTIHQSMNDYKRDQHSDAKNYEKNFLVENIKAKVKIPFFVYATNSGMSALTTIAHLILTQTDNNSIILLGKNSYFEEKILLYSIFKDRVIEFDEYNIESLENHIKNLAPSAIFIDSLTNNSEIVLPNIQDILSKLKKIISKDTYLVIDNTARSVSHQLFDQIFIYNLKLHIFVWESLLKHHQFGLDRVNAGIIYSRSNKAGHLYTLRDHLGTNISDTAAISLPKPNYQLLQNRLQRHERNVSLIVESLTKLKGNGTIEEIVSPLTATHPSIAWAKTVPFHGSFISIRLVPKKNTLVYYQKVIEHAFLLAKRENIQLVGGSSFGLTVTRMYIPASRPGQGTPFLRLAIGTEPFIQTLKIIDICKEVLK